MWRVLCHAVYQEIEEASLSACTGFCDLKGDDNLMSPISLGACVGEGSSLEEYAHPQALLVLGSQAAQIFHIRPLAKDGVFRTSRRGETQFALRQYTQFLRLQT